MKNFFKLLILLITIFSYNSWYSYDLEENFQNVDLIEKYLQNHRIKINTVINKYNLENDTEIKVELSRIDNILSTINKIKSKKIDNKKEDEIIKIIINEIKSINNELKISLKIKIDNHEKELEKTIKVYHEIWLKISKKLDELYTKFYKKDLNEKRVITIEESKLKNSINNLYSSSKKLSKFDKIKFTNKEEVKESFIRILREIKDDIKTIKKYY